MTTTPTRRESEPVPATDVARLVVDKAKLRHPRVHLGIVIALGTIAGTCLLACVTRMSALPLLSLVPLPVAAYAEWRARATTSDRNLMWWLTLLAVTIAVSFWLLSWVGRIID